MARMVFTNAYLLLNGVDLSNHVEAITLDWQKTDVDVTAMGDGGKQHLAGIEDNKATVTFWNDYQSSSVDATLGSIMQGATAVAFKIGGNGTAFSSTNPSYSGSALVLSTQPVAGKVNDGLQAQVQLVVCGTITRGTT